MNTDNSQYRLISIKNLTPETFLIRIERNNFQFEPGQYVILRDPETRVGREYSIYSGKNDPYIEFLVREVKDGSFSRFLKNLRPGSLLELEGPKGFFILDEIARTQSKLIFISTGTGISPFHSLVKSYPEMNYKLLHGVHFADETYGIDDFVREKVTVCTSRVPDGDYFGRVTYLLKETEIDLKAIYMLCGNSAMVDEVMDLLESAGVAPENIRSEVFF